MLELSWEAIGALYALRYVFDVDRPAAAGEIARDGRLPPRLVKKVLRRMQKAGMIRSVRGRGYVLDRAPGSISIVDVLQVVDGSEVAARRCRMDYQTCPVRYACPFLRMCEEVHESSLRALREFTLADFQFGERTLPLCMPKR